ncbi:Methionyl-tRNA formyltransferase mitochondrial [Paragonimus heterotremus]|uniref:Methionyl-tRNA formyltransferase mitochondrial n=1 Tax=Paragonimus heterotremus TaxID=100268 RepID=A0A8J4TL30_9TREM|nr:Methionyl-tRNA formyltransferase mitochondrial [Paragonimus heterotremus]
MRISLANCAARSTINLVYFGSDAYSLAHLRSLREYAVCGDFPTLHVKHVVTANDRTPVAHYCKDVNYTYSTWPRHISSSADDLVLRLQDMISSCKPVNLLGLIVSFGRRLPPKLISAFPHGCINIHPSLLPRWRGPCPLFHTLLAGDRVTGITIIRLTSDEHALDSGPVLYQRSLRLQPELLTTGQLAQHLIPHSIEAMYEVLRNPDYISLDYTPPTQTDITNRTGLTNCHASHLTPEMSHIAWEQQSASDIVRLWHAFEGTAISLRTQMSIPRTVDRKDTCAQLYLSGHAPVVVPNVVDQPATILQTEIGSHLHEAAYLLATLPDSFPHGGLVYLRSQWNPSHHLLPFAFVSCKPESELSQQSESQRSWLAISSVKVRWPGSSRPELRLLTALDLFNGYLKELPSLRLSDPHCVPQGCHLFNGFSSAINPFWPPPKPWTILTEPILLPGSIVHKSSVPFAHSVDYRTYSDG